MSDRGEFMPPETAGDWMAVDGPHHDVVVTSRIRLARNVRGFQFRQLLKRFGNVIQLVFCSLKLIFILLQPCDFFPGIG